MRGLEVELLSPGVGHDALHEGPEVVGVAAERAAAEHPRGPLGARVRVVAAVGPGGHQSRSVRLVPEHAVQRRRNADTAADVAAEAQQRAARSTLQSPRAFYSLMSLTHY